MIRALAIKELRETIGIAVVALIIYAYSVFWAMGVSLLPWSRIYQEWIPFVRDPTLMFLGVVTACLAVALGFRQTVWETAFGTEQFLLHRPMSRERLMGVKLLTGMAVLLILSGLPILGYAWWAATPGTHASPFEWSMTLSFWKVWMAMTPVYLGSFLSGIRPGRWLGTRLFPLVAVGFLTFLFTVLPVLPVLPILQFLGIVILDVLLVVSILFAAGTRDF